MRTLALAITVIAAFALPISSASAETVVIKKDHHRHMDRSKKVVVINHDRGHHYGWRKHHVEGSHDRGHHYGWHKHHAEGSKVIIKRD